MIRKLRKLMISAVCALSLTAVFLCAGLTALAAEKPDIAAEGAVLYNASTGEFLYEKNADQRFYPASITKILTALLVLENCSLDEVVTFTDSATKNLESGAVSLGVTTGDRISVNDCLYGLLLKSANEVANGLAEHVSGSVPAFCELMNQKARQLGCTNSNFRNPNGLTNSDHYTSPRDMARIADACFRNPAFLAIEKSTVYHFPATINRPEGTTIAMGHKMIAPGGAQYYNGILGGKTGYTSAAGNTLVTCVERDGIRLITVIMKSRSTHYADTKKLLDYGFSVAQKGDRLTGTAVTAAAGQSGSGAGAENAGPGAELSMAAAGNTAVAGTDSGAASSGTAVTGGTAMVTASPGTVTAGPAGENMTASETAGPQAAGPGAETAAAQTSPAAMETAAVQTSPAAAETAAVQTTSAGTQTAGESGPAADLTSGWHQKDGGWYYVREDGTRAKGTRLTIEGYDYWFGEDGTMITGWYHAADGGWYYLRPSFGGMKKSTWLQDNGKWYYLGDDGKMLTDTVTPDGYHVGADGVCLEQ